MCEKETAQEVRTRVRSPRAEQPQTGPAVRRIFLFPSARTRVPRSFLCLSPLSRSDDWAGYSCRRRLRRRPTPGSEAFVGIFTGDEHPPGIPTPSLPFLLCETEHPNPNLNLFGYLMSTSFEIFAKIIGCTCPFTGSALVLVLTVSATSRYCLQYFLQ